MSDLLSIYLNDHLAGAGGGVALARRVAGSRTGEEGEQTRRLAQQIGEDRDSLIAIMNRLGLRRTFYKEPFAVIAERAGRWKSNGTFVRRSPLSDIVEYEMLALGITGKRAGWQSLRELTPSRPGLDGAELDVLIQRADEQLEVVQQLRLAAVGRSLGG
jgi:hypothetical protein